MKNRPQAVKVDAAAMAAVPAQRGGNSDQADSDEGAGRKKWGRGWK